MEVYESHMGGIYFSKVILDFDDLYCDECGDSDWHLGHADTWDEVMKLITDHNVFPCSSLEDLKKEFEEMMS